MNQQAQGLYQKFNVTRTDGRDAPGEKHHGAEYFVLDLSDDPLAWPAVAAYAEACAADFPQITRPGATHLHRDDRRTRRDAVLIGKT